MKTIKTFLVIPFLLLFIGMCGCEDDKDNCNSRPVNGPKDNIVGKWKQVSVERVPKEHSLTADYSCDNIVYSFQKEGKLIITSDRDDYIGHQVGEYEYEFVKSSIGENSHDIFIEGEEYPCVINKDNTMTFDLEPYPGPLGVRNYRTILYFIRIQ